MIMSVKFDTSKVHIKSLVTALGAPAVAPILNTSVQAVLVPQIRRNIRENKSVDSGNLFRNIRTRIGFSASVFSAAIDVGSIGVDYGLDVEQGRGPHSPDLAKLRAWVARKLQPKHVGLTAFRIFQSIEKKGVEARPYLMKAFNTEEGRLADDFVLRMRVRLGT